MFALGPDEHQPGFEPAAHDAVVRGAQVVEDLDRGVGGCLPAHRRRSPSTRLLAATEFDSARPGMLSRPSNSASSPTCFASRTSLQWARGGLCGL